MARTTGTPLAASAVERMARALTDEALAHRIEMILDNRRSMSKADADQLLAEAARRLRWGRKADSDAGLVVLTAGGRVR